MGMELEEAVTREQTLTKEQLRAAEGVLVIASVEELCEKMGHVRVTVADGQPIEGGSGENAFELHPK